MREPDPRVAGAGCQGVGEMPDIGPVITSLMMVLLPEGRAVAITRKRATTSSPCSCKQLGRNAAYLGSNRGSTLTSCGNWAFAVRPRVLVSHRGAERPLGIICLFE